MTLHDKKQKINRILYYKSYRTYFDDFSHEFNKVELESKLDRLADLVSKGYLDTAIEEYLNCFDDCKTYAKLTIMKRALAITLKGYLGKIRCDKYGFQKNISYNIGDDELDYIIESFKNDIIEIYIPKRGYNIIFTL